MKKLLFAGLVALSMNAFSQSYMVLQNGVVLTMDKSGFVYDLVISAMPYNVDVNGGQFMVESEKLVTIDDKGYLYNKDEKVGDKSYGKGLNYLFDEHKDLVTIASDGLYYKYKFEDGKGLYKKDNRYGGNFFIVTRDARRGLADLYTVNSKGNYFRMALPGLNPARINILGGNYFTYGGSVYTVNKDGIIIPKGMIKMYGIKAKGGNFFIDVMNQVWTITDEGVLSTPVTPANLNVAKINKLGSSYMLDTDGNLFTVDAITGNINYREVPYHDLRNAKILSNPI
jgi:hypothetical protein